ncbi:hypothetical protein DPMN_188670 [Dreissena polymorpha]|uniref:SUEL-type lectin domain-containing protein n=2 Tax=Dreissena polymorpha TaxID=45954 RepID=A0A9D4DTV0_DREPO|nr:hypothetical protein DPMN_188670 [Dreissena polymorpha]
MVFGLLRIRHSGDKAGCPDGEPMMILQANQLLECFRQCSKIAACKSFSFADRKCELFNASIVPGKGSGCYATEKPEYVMFCENQMYTLSCPLNLQLNIIGANYGRTRADYCPGPIQTTDCVLDSSLSKVQAACQGKNSCVISSNVEFFGKDPCYGTYKYVEVTYTCI